MFQHVSSIAAAGMYEGVFREDMFDEAENLDHPYFATKHDSEKIVRKECEMPWRVYRPGLVVGDSKTGEMDKIDGPYYFFKLIQRMRSILPPWMPAIGIEGGRINIVPVDFVVDAIDHIAHKKDLDGKAFHLVDPTPYRVGDILNIFAKAAHAPQFSLRVNAALLGFIPNSVKKGMLALTPVRRIKNAVMKDLGVPDDILTFVNYPTRFDARETTAALKGTKIECPRLEDYAYRLWDYWERNLDPDLFIDRTLKGQVQGKVVVITGGSSGIGLAAAHKIAERRRDHGAHRARRGEARQREEGDRGGARQEREPRPGRDALGRPRQQRGRRPRHGLDRRDLRRGGLPGQQRRPLDPPRHRVELRPHARLRAHDAGQLLRRAADDDGADAAHVGEAARPGDQHLVDRRADQRAALLGLRRVQGRARRLDGAARRRSSPTSGVKFTTINMPLVRTPMIAPTKLYQNVPTLSPDEAADLIVRAIVYKPVRIATRLGIFGAVLHALAPRIAQIVMNTTFRMFPDSDAAKGAKDGEKVKASADQIAFANLMRGIHF